MRNSKPAKQEHAKAYNVRAFRKRHAYLAARCGTSRVYQIKLVCAWSVCVWSVRLRRHSRGLGAGSTERSG